MKNDTEKLNRFKNAVFEDVERQATEIIEEADRESSEKVRSAQQETKLVYEKKRADFDKAEKENSVREVSSEEINARKEILRYREEITDKVFSAVIEQVNGFSKTKEYAVLMKKRAEKCADENKGEKGTIYIRHEDSAIAGDLSKSGNFEVVEKENILYGGIMVAFEDSGIVYDYTVDSKLEEERRNFAGKAGLSVI